MKAVNLEGTVMKRLWKLLLCLLLAVLTLSACSGQPSNTEQFPEVT